METPAHRKERADRVGGNNLHRDVESPGTEQRFPYNQSAESGGLPCSQQEKRYSCQALIWKGNSVQEKQDTWPGMRYIIDTLSAVSA